MANSGQHAIKRSAAAPFQHGQRFRSLRRASSFGSNQFHRLPITSIKSSRAAIP
jgi:hypothetical protein